MTDRFTINPTDATAGGLLAASRRLQAKGKHPTTTNPMPFGDVAGVLAYLAKGTTTRIRPRTPFFRQAQVRFSRADLLAAFAKLEIGKLSERIAARELFKTWGFTVGRAAWPAPRKPHPAS